MTTESAALAIFGTTNSKNATACQFPSTFLLPFFPTLYNPSHGRLI